MPVELRLEEAGEPDPAPGADRDGPAAAGSAAAVLRDLIAARLVTHEAIGDPGRLGAEPAALRALCGLVAGPVYRLAPFHYAFAAREGELDPTARTAALGAALAAALGPEAVWLGATDLAPGVRRDAGPESEFESGPESGSEPGPEPMPEAALVVLRAGDAAVTGGLAAADPSLRAVIDARLAAETARRAAEFAAALGLGAGAADAALDLDRRLAAIETRLADNEAVEARAREAQAREARAFEARLGLALAEFLARIERRDAVAAPVA